MNKTLFHRTIVLMLISALAFGQVGARFLHNKHDAHEEVIDLDKTVLLNHGEHCKVCALDWASHSDIVFFEFDFFKTEYNFSRPIDVSSLTDVAIIIENNKAPPVLS